MGPPKLGFKLSAEQHAFRTRVIVRLREIGFTAPVIADIFTMSAPSVSRLAKLPEKTLEQRFDEKYRVDDSGCWLWTEWLDSDGYGIISIKHKNHRAHRVSYERYVGKIPDGMVIDHLCRVRHCVNPDHLRVVTNAENVLCGEGKTARLARQTHCINGHSLEDAYITKDGYRQCTPCNRARAKGYREKRLTSN